MGWVGRLDDFQREHLWLGIAIAVVYKFIDDQGTYLAALITFYGFPLLLFPLLLLLVTLLGYALQGDVVLQQEIVHSALSQFPVLGGQLQANVHSLHGNLFALLVGVIGAVYEGPNVTVVAQYAMNGSGRCRPRTAPILLSRGPVAR